MKFGKKILNAGDASSALCDSSLWLDYKLMKKLLKTFKPEDSETKDEHAIKSNPDERRFFTILKHELQKVEEGFLRLQGFHASRLLHVLQTTAKEAKEEDLLDLHLKFLLLQNYAVLNYVGFTKILKKHDKVTGFSTKDQFLLKLVDDQQFSRHEGLQDVIELFNRFMVSLNKGSSDSRELCAALEILKSGSRRVRTPKRYRTDSLGGAPGEEPVPKRLVSGQGKNLDTLCQAAEIATSRV